MKEKKNSGFIATHVDRKTRYTIAGKMENKRAETFNIAVKNSFADYDDIKTITYDNGVEMSAYKELEEMLDCLIYFADPGKPGQRGLNENTNGLLRQYFKKGSDFKKINQKNVDEAVHKLNHRPRKCLGYMTPYEAFFEKKKLCCISGLNAQNIALKKENSHKKRYSAEQPGDRIQFDTVCLGINDEHDNSCLCCHRY